VASTSWAGGVAGKLDQTGQVVPGAGQTTTVVVQGRGQVAGAGILLATLNPSRTVSEASYDNNFKQLNVTIT
jgi:hypothetical protein